MRERRFRLARRQIISLGRYRSRGLTKSTPEDEAVQGVWRRAAEQRDEVAPRDASCHLIPPAEGRCAQR